MFRRCMTPTRWVGKGNCFSGGSEADLNSILDEESTVPILAEIVGATHLPALSNASLPDPYCVVRVGDKVVHETAELNDEDNPIWTVKTRSLCILSIPDPSSIGGSDEVPEAEEVSEESSTPESVTGKINEKECVVVEICSGKQCLGKVSVPFQHVLKGQGEREEFPIIDSTNKGKDNDNKKVTLANQEERVLALRFREASTDDILFIQHRRQHSATAVIGRQLSKNVITPVSRSLSNVTCNVPSETEYDEIATDLDFQKVNKKSLLASYRKKDPKTGESLLRLQPPKPNSDPEDPATEEMAWMSKAQIKTEALKPSTNWIEAGNGEAGTLYLEIIGCDNLPNMDLGMNDMSDPFVGVVFEDVMVRTNVLFDTLNPRWMPWSTRAYAINITHTGSLLFLGVFDYDENIAITDFNDPIGRVVISTVNFNSGVTYLLHYNLRDNSQVDDNRGTITVRLRIIWKDENEAAKLALKSPPRFIINVGTKKAWAVLHYCCFGSVNMEQASMASIKLYISELKEYRESICCFLDLIANIILWRGKATLSFCGYQFSIWFPIHSIWLFTSAVLAFEKPKLAPPIFFFGIAWVMISLNYNYSRLPFPWDRVKRFEDLVLTLTFKRSPPASVRQVIEPFTAIEEKEQITALRKLKADRMAALLSAFVDTSLKALRIYSGTSITNIKDTTEDKAWHFLSGKLHYPHMVLSHLCKYARAFRSFLDWTSHGSFPKTMNCLILAVLWFFLPLNFVVTNVCRIWLWTHGPWMKLIDIIWVHKYFKTNEELWDDVLNDRQDSEYNFLAFFDSIIEHHVFRKMRKTGRLVAEDAAKLKDMRESVNGEWSEMVPWVDNSRYSSVPRPESSARPFTSEENVQLDGRRWRYVPGNRLEGSMILRHPKPPQTVNIMPPNNQGNGAANRESKKTK